MKITQTLSRYLARTYLVNMVFLLVALMSVIYLFDTVELLRRASKFKDIPLPLVLQMSFMKLPEVAQIMFPFAILFSAMFTFWQLTKRHELVVVRSSGFSVWQFLAPIALVAVIAGFLQMGVINPIGSLLLTRFEQLERTHLTRQDDQIAIFKGGLWLRQGGEGEQGYAILHSPKISQPGWALQNVSVLYFENDDNFVGRVDAKQATLEKSRWLFKDVVIHRTGGVPERQAQYVLPTNLTIADVEESFSSPQSMSFWRLPGHIETLEETGFDASRLKVHYQNLLSQPLMYMAMVLLAATVSMRPHRFRGPAILLGVGIMFGFVVFFMSSYLQALGSSGQIPVVLAAWSPALICFLFGLGVIMNLEDG